MNSKLYFILIFISIFLSCHANTPIKVVQCQTIPKESFKVKTDSSVVNVGFEFGNIIPEHPEGDNAAPKHLFIHQYLMPKSGEVIGVTYLNDKEYDHSEFSENTDFLILRKVEKGWRIISRTSLPCDDEKPATTGTTTIIFDNTISVEKDDCYANWQSSDMPTGPIPNNIENRSIEGKSFGKYGFDDNDLKVGNVISDEGFSGPRDYYINVLFKSANSFIRRGADDDINYKIYKLNR
jgi:hypothetical protein